MAQTAGGTYYAASSELVSSWPATSLDLANQLESRFAAKAPLASPALTGSPTVGGAALVASKVFQTVSTLKSDNFSTSSTTFVDVTGLSATLTPSSTSNKVLVIVSLPLQNNTAGGSSRGAILRGSTQVGGGTAVGSRGSATFRVRIPDTGAGVGPVTFTFLDSPATTSATTYKVQVAAESTTSALVGVSAGRDSDAGTDPRLASSITLIEVAP